MKRNFIVFRVAPKIKHLEREYTIAQGQDLSITCEACGTPYPTIKWTKVHSSFESNIQQTGNVLRIINAQPDNRGVFLCVVENTLGSDQAATRIDVERKYNSIILFRIHKQIRANNLAFLRFKIIFQYI